MSQQWLTQRNKYLTYRKCCCG